MFQLKRNCTHVKNRLVCTLCSINWLFEANVAQHIRFCIDTRVSGRDFTRLNEFGKNYVRHQFQKNDPPVNFTTMNTIMTRNDPKWPKMTQNDPKWPLIIYRYSKWPITIKRDTELPIIIEMTHIYPYWPITTQIDPMCLK